VIINEEFALKGRFCRGESTNTPHLNPLPQGERKKRFIVNLRTMARLPRRTLVRCVKMLLKLGLEWPIYVSTKRTQFIWRRKLGLSDCMANGSAEKILAEKLGSFSKTNPIWRLFKRVLRVVYGVSVRSGNYAGGKMLRIYRLRDDEYIGARRKPPLTRTLSPKGRGDKNDSTGVARELRKWHEQAVCRGQSLPFTCLVTRL
jgi:hypothetical protein